MDLEVRQATLVDAPIVTRIIALAFAADPAWGPAMARPDGSAAHLAALWRPFIDGALRYPDTWLTAGGEAAAVWIPPGGTGMTPELEDRLAGLAAAHLGPTAGEFLELLDRVHGAHPPEPHYFLSLLGTDPDHRGHGFGMRLAEQTLRRVDDMHQPAYLESTNPVNDAKYAGLGFEPYGQIVCPDGHLITTMWRPAR